MKPIVQLKRNSVQLLAEFTIRLYRKTRSDEPEFAAVKQDQTVNPPRYLIFFKAKDTDVIAQAFKEYVHVSSKRKERPSLKAKLVRLQKSLSKTKNRERTREKDRGRGVPSL